MKIRFLLLFILSAISSSAQTKGSSDYLPWSASRRLILSDFQIKADDAKTYSSSAQFMIDFASGGFDFFNKNFNKRVHNYFIKSASWIDTTVGVEQSIRYEQVLFDIAEIYARHFRKALKENKKKSLTDPEYAKKINVDIMTAFAKRRMEVDKDTDGGRSIQKISEWEMVVRNELAMLEDFASEP